MSNSIQLPAADDENDEGDSDEGDEELEVGVIGRLTFLPLMKDMRKCSRPSCNTNFDLRSIVLTLPCSLVRGRTGDKIFDGDRLAQKRRITLAKQAS